MAKSGQKLSSDTVAEMIRMKVAGVSDREICESLKVAKSTVHMYCRTSGRDVPGVGVTDDGVVSFSSKGDTASGEYKTAAVPTEQTLPGILRECGADLTTWAVKEWSYRAWTTGMMKKGKGGDDDEVIHSKQYSIHVKFARVMPVALRDATDAIFERMKAHAPKYAVPKYKAAKGRDESFLGVISLTDAHAGKLCWHPETGTDYDLKIFEAVYRNAVDDLIAESRGRKIERFLLPIGSDFYHIDNARNTTFNGTAQDVDGRYAKVIETGEMAVIWAVERLMAIAPVSVVWIPGNHDPSTSFHLARTVQAWFRQCGRVDVDAGPSSRKYFAWGCNLLGLTHGDQEKPSSLPSLMATERPHEWAASTCREWLLGHMHRSRQWQTQGVDTFEGTTVRVLRSLAGTDSWHHRKGYISGSQKAAEALYYGKTRGLAGYSVVPQRQG